MGSNTRNLTPKQRAFAHNYVTNGGDAVNAARDAQYSEKYAKHKAHLLLDHAPVIDEIKRRRTRMNERADKTATDVVNEFSKIAFADRVSFLKEDPHYPDEFIYKSPDELTDEQRAIVEKVTYNNHEITVIENGEVQKLWVKHYTYVLADKANALEKMGRHFGIFDDKIALRINQSNPFKDATPAQLEKLKESWIRTMSTPAIEGQFEEVKANGK